MPTPTFMSVRHVPPVRLVPPVLLALFVLTAPVVASEEALNGYRAITVDGATLIRRGASSDPKVPSLHVAPVAFTPQSPLSMLNQLAQLLPAGGALAEHATLALREVRTDIRGGQHAVYDLTYRGLRVLGGGMRVHGVPERGNVVSSMEWHAFPAGPAGMHHRANPDQLFINFFVGGDTLHEHSTPTPVFVLDSHSTLRAAWASEVTWKPVDLDQRWDRLVLADDDGTVLDLEPLLRYALQRFVKDRASGVERNENDPLTGNETVDTLFAHLETVHESALQLFGLDSFDGAGSLIRAEANIADLPGGAQAFSSKLAFGAASGPQGNLALDLDVVAHEYAHLILERHAELRTDAIASGALAESLPDVFAALVSAHNGLPDPMWHTVQEWTPGVSGDALRYLDNPSANAEGGTDYRLPLTGHVGTTGFEPCQPERQVLDESDRADDSQEMTLLRCPNHHNSGVPSLAFALLSGGGFHPRELSPMSVNGVGATVAGEIFFSAALEKQAGDTTLAQFKEHTVAVAAEKFGSQSAAVIETCKAWFAVGASANPPGSDCAIIPTVPFGLAIATERCQGLGDVSWNTVAGATHFRVWSFPEQTELRSGILEVETPDTEATVLIAGPDRFVRVQACNAHTCGALSGWPVRIEGTDCEGEDGDESGREVTP